MKYEYEKRQDLMIAEEQLRYVYINEKVLCAVERLFLFCNPKTPMLEGHSYFVTLKCPCR
jgi:hypothetical protein